jgi:hypothetical protein
LEIFALAIEVFPFSSAWIQQSKLVSPPFKLLNQDANLQM